MEKRGTHRHGMIAKKFPENSTAVPPLLGPFLEIGIAAGCLWRGEKPFKNRGHGWVPGMHFFHHQTGRFTLETY